MKFQKLEQHAGTDKFLKIKDGETVKVVFCGEIHEYYVKWDNGKSQIVGSGEGGKIRFRVNVAVPEGAAIKMKIFEFGVPVYEQMGLLNKTYGDITKLKIAIIRRGEKLSTTYILLPLLNEPLAPPVLAKIESLDLHFLNAQKKSNEPATDAFQDVPMPDPDSFVEEMDEPEIPF